MEVIYFLATDGIKLDGLLYTSKNKTEDIILSIHGMGSNCMKKRETTMAKFANENNIDYFCFNNRGSELVKYIRRYTEGKREKGWSVFVFAWGVSLLFLRDPAWIGSGEALSEPTGCHMSVFEQEIRLVPMIFIGNPVRFRPIVHVIVIIIGIPDRCTV